MRAFVFGLTVFASGLVSGAALAGDFADREMLGFSPDGRYFAFEEFGIQDGSGFPYSNVFVVEVDSDSWVSGTPIRVRTDTDGALLIDTRFEAREQAQPILSQYQIGEMPWLVASNPPTESSADPHLVRFLPRLILPTSDSEFTLALEELPLPAARDCPQDSAYQGFRLTLTEPAGPRTLNEDAAIPSSRNCPLNYGISDVFTFYPDSGEPVLVVLISVFSYGFEGPDRRFLAVATRFPG